MHTFFEPRRQSVAVVLAVLLALSARTPHARGQGEVKLEDILKAGERRQAQAPSLRFAWIKKETDARGSRTLPKPYNPSGEVVPPQDATFEDKASLLLDGEKMRYAHDIYDWSKEKQMFVPCPYVSTFDGKLLKTLHEKSSPSEPFPQGTIEAKQRHFDVQLVHLMPLLMTFRAANPNMRMYDLSEMSLTGRKSRIQERACLELQRQDPAGSGMDRLWVDPSRDFVIVRYVRMDEEKPSLQVDVRFRQDSKVGWAPSERLSGKPELS